jgi:hypothetical protein
MNYYNLCGIGSQHSNISKGKGGWGYTYMQDSNSRLQQRRKATVVQSLFFNWICVNVCKHMSVCK